MTKHSHYHKDVSHLKSVDVYRVLQLFGVTDQCVGHAVKKLLCAGQRGSKGIMQDIQEAIDTLQRWQQMQAEDAEFTLADVSEITPAPATVSTSAHQAVQEWPADESRIDVIGQNGNDGAAYRCSDCLAEHCACVAR
jgi:hypothetical protein